MLFLGGVLMLRRQHQHFQPRVIVPMLLESTIYALTMGSLIILVMTRVLGIEPSLSAALQQGGHPFPRS